MLLNVAILRPRLLSLVATGRVTRAEVDQFIRGAVISLVVFALLAEAIVLAAGWPNPLCVYTEPRTSPGVVASWGLTVIAWALLFWWVWRGRGADLLARLGPALMRGQVRATAYTPRQVRLATAALIAIMAVSLAMNLLMQRPDLSCHGLSF